MLRTTLLLLALAVSACSPYLHSPPARMVPLEAPQSLAKGDVAIQGAIGGGAAVWGPSVVAGTLQGRYGFGRGFEGALEGGFAVAGARDTNWDTDASHALGAGRAGFKYAPVSWFALQAGFGGGGSEAGGFVSPDVGLIFGYQGEAVVPFIAAGFYSSHPINPKTITFRDNGDVELIAPDTTIGGYGNFGLRIPVTRPASSKSPRTAIVIAYRFVAAAHDEYFGGSIGPQRYVEWYHIGALAFDFVLRKHPSLPGKEGGWKLY